MYENSCMWEAMLDDIEDAEKLCPISCIYRQYDSLVDFIYADDSTIAINFASTEITTYEEYLIYDFAGMVGSVGGNLGLFVGWSFHDLVKIFMNCF